MYDIMTPGPTQVRENVRQARALACTNPDLDADFYDFYKETCEETVNFLYLKKRPDPGRGRHFRTGSSLCHSHRKR